MNTIDTLRLAMPRQFTKLTKLCAKCGAKVVYDDTARALKCPRCKATY